MKLYMVEVFDITNSDRTTWWLPTKAEALRVWQWQIDELSKPRDPDEEYAKLEEFDVTVTEVESKYPRNKADICVLLEALYARGGGVIKSEYVQQTWANDERS